MATIGQYILLRDVVFSYSEAAKMDDTKFLRLWRICFRGFKQLGLNGFWQPVTVNLPINDNKTVTLPDDYIKWTKVGQMTGNEITLLKNNQGLLTATGTYNGAADVVNSDWWHIGFNRLGRTCHISNIEFKIDGDAILLNTNFTGDHLLLEYLASPEQCDDFQIPMEFEEAMIDWLSWQDVKHIPASSHFGRGDKNDRALAFRASRKKAWRDYRPFRLSEIMGGQAEFNSSSVSATNNVIYMPPPPPAATFVVQWDYVVIAESTIPTAAYLDALILIQNASIATGANISLTIPPAINNTYKLVVRYPIAESTKTKWYNTALNNGIIPDQIFLPITVSTTYKYIVSRINGLGLDNTSPTIFS
jgi:hypothetical protein